MSLTKIYEFVNIGNFLKVLEYQISSKLFRWSNMTYFFGKNFRFNQLSDVKLKVSHVSVREEVTCAYFALNRVT